MAVAGEQILTRLGFEVDGISLKSSLEKVAAFGSALRRAFADASAALVGVAKGEAEVAAQADALGVSVERFAEFAAAYPKKCTGCLAESEYCNAVMAGVPEDDLILAAQNYADACRRDRTAERYIKKAENWLRENVFMQYLKGAGNGADGTNAGENTTAHEKSINERLGELGDTGEFEGF